MSRDDHVRAIAAAMVAADQWRADRSRELDNLRADLRDLPYPTVIEGISKLINAVERVLPAGRDAVRDVGVQAQVARRIRVRIGAIRSDVDAMSATHHIASAANRLADDDLILQSRLARAVTKATT